MALLIETLELSSKYTFHKEIYQIITEQFSRFIIAAVKYVDRKMLHSIIIQLLKLQN